MTTEELKTVCRAFVILGNETKLSDGDSYRQVGFDGAYHTARLADAQELTNQWLCRIEGAIRDAETKAWLMEIASQLTLIGQKP